MTPQEIINEIQKLPLLEQREVAEHLQYLWMEKNLHKMI